MRFRWTAPFALFCLLAILAGRALAGVPTVVFVDEFGFQTCPYCPNSICAVEELQSQYPNQVIWADEHTSEHFSNQYTVARANWYGVNAAPTAFFNGGGETIGDYGSCAANYGIYQPIVANLLTQNSGLSPVSITGTFAINGSTANLSATFTLVDPVNLGTVRASFFLLEDDITYCCDAHGGNQWHHITRVIDYQPVTTLINQGDTATANSTMTLDPSWNTNNLMACVVLEHPSNPKQIIQASMLPPNDVTLSTPQQVLSIPQGSNAATFALSVFNFSTANDPVTLSVDQNAGWPTDFQIQGDPNWYTSKQITLAGSQTIAVTLRVQTDANKRTGTADFTAYSGNAGRSQSLSFLVFNLSPAILFVDDDNGGSYNGVPYDQPYRDGLDQNGYLYTWWDVANGYGGVTPSAAAMVGYDAVVWQTAYQTGGFLADPEIKAIESYLDSGGRLYLNSMDYLSVINGPTTFTTNYLGVASWTNNTKANTENGVSGDPISDGLTLPLTWPAPGANRTDTLVPTSNAVAIFQNESGYDNAVRNTVGAQGRVVFLTFPQNVLSTSAPDPNNNKSTMGRILSWILTTDVTAAPEPVAGRTGFLTANPNPLHSSAELSFRLSTQAAAGPVQLELLDANGRVIRSLLDGRTTAGAETAVWDGRDAAGRTVPSGIYFARLKSIDGESTAKLVMLR